MSAGHLSYCGYSFIFKMNLLFYCGKNLESLYEDVLKQKLMNQKILANTLTSEYLSGLELLLLNINGYNHYSNEFELISANAAEILFMQRTENSSTAIALVCFLIFKAHILYHYNQPWLALQCLQHAQNKLVYISGWINQVYFYFLQSLCKLALIAKHPHREHQCRCHSCWHAHGVG